jgi:hypothetical protein
VRILRIVDLAEHVERRFDADRDCGADDLERQYQQ